MQSKLSAILRCPEDHTALAPASQVLVDQLNAAIRAGWLLNRSGQQVRGLIDGGLVRAADDVLYPIVDQIPVLLRDEAIPLNQLHRRGAE